jgi:transposase-like protein
MENEEKEGLLKCPKCGSTKNQMKSGFTRAGSQRHLCRQCKHKYTPNPQKWAYTEEERKQALRLITDGATGRGVGRQLNMSKSNAYRWAVEESKKGV